ncbi:hypothetical protein EPN83_02415 [Patescibacteria group bacterium]|nr:MAG: hypothetical protein EPN83_02415 [Patescibacteria group bacterium]
MVLAVHGVVAGALATVARANPVTGFFIGFLSHFLLDAFPHWDYFHLLPSFSKQEGQKVRHLQFVRDIFWICCDIGLGVLLSLLFFVFHRDLGGVVTKGVFWAIIGSIVPDVLQYLAMKLPWKPLTLFRRLHDYFHSKTKLNGAAAFGIGIQVVVVILAASLTFF